MVRIDIHFYETYVPTAWLIIISTVFDLAGLHGWSLFHMYVNNTFLNGNRKLLVYFDQPPDLFVHDKECCIYRLRRAVYGLKHFLHVVPEARHFSPSQNAMYQGRF